MFSQMSVKDRSLSYDVLGQAGMPPQIRKEGLLSHPSVPLAIVVQGPTPTSLPTGRIGMET